MMFELKVEEDNTYSLIPGKIYLIGRKNTNNNGGPQKICLPDESLDSKHAIIEICNETAYIIDLQSDAGTFLNGRRLETMVQAKITSTDSLRFGLRLCAKLSSPNDGEKSHDCSGFHDIPETQYFHNPRSSLGSKNVSVADSDYMNKTNDDYDLFIPETQEVPNRFHENNVIVDANLSASQCAPDVSSQFRICTQLFNESCVVDIDSNSESDEFDFLAGIERGNKADKVGQLEEASATNEARKANVVDDAEMCALNWSAITSKSTTSKNTTINVTAAEVLRDDASTPDLCDFPEEEQDKIRAMLNVSSCKFTSSKVATETSAVSQLSNVTTLGTTLNGTTSEVLRDDASTPDLCDFPEDEQDKIRAILNVSSCKFTSSKSATETTAASKSSNVTTLGNTISEALRVNASTPELGDIPEKQQNKIREFLNTSSTSFAEPKASAEPTVNATIMPLAEPFPLDEEEDLLPTQVFVRKPVDKKSKMQLDKVEPVYLTLSDKENVGPIVSLDVPEMSDEILTATQIFTIASSTSSATSISTKSTIPTNSTTKSQIKHDGNLDDFVPTQLFPASKTTNPADKTDNCFNYSLPVNDEKIITKNSASCFADLEKSPPKATRIQSDDAFKKPEPCALLKKTSSISNAASLLDLPSDLESDMLMCTPQFLKEKFVDCSAAVSKQSLIAAKQRSLFGDDSDSEEDILKLINIPKMSKDFDILLPKDKSFNCSHEKTSSASKAKQEEIKTQKMHLLFGSNNTSTSDKEAMNQSRSRDERHSARDKEHAVTKSKAKDTAAEQMPKRGSKRKTSSNLEAATEAKIQKIDTAKSKVKEIGKLVKTRSKIYEQKQDQPVKDDIEKQSHDKIKQNEKEMPSKRMTRLRSRTEAIEEAEIDKTKAISCTTKGSGRSARKQLSTDSQENGCSLSAITLKEVGKLVKTSSKIYEQKQDQPKKDDSEKQSHDKTKQNEKKIDMPSKRMTRLRSCTEAIQEAGIDKTNAISRTTKGSGRSARKQFTTDSQENGCSLGALTSEKSANEPKSKVQTQSRDEPKQFRSTSSQDDSTASGSSKITELKEAITMVDPQVQKQKQSRDEPKQIRSTSSQDDSTASVSNKITKLKVTMTMVDPQLFGHLTNNSSGMWTIAKDPMDSDILIMDKGNRTFKFLLAMAKGIPIVTSKWLECVNNTNIIATKAEHFFADVAFEKRHKFTLLKSLEKARKHRLFESYDFLMTPGIQPQPEEMKAIVECAGGTVLTNPPPLLEGAKMQKIYLISSAKEKQHWHKYRRVNNNIRIISCEGVMSSVMRQQVEPLDKFLLA